MSGFSVIELLIALMVIASCIVAVTLVALGTPNMLSSASREVTAHAQATALLEREEVIARGDFSRVVSVATTSDGIYESALTVTLLSDEMTKRIAASVSWIDLHAVRRTVTLTSYITDFKNADGYSCAPTSSGNWLSPYIRSYIFSSSDLFPPDLPIATSSIETLAVSGNRLFAGAAQLAHNGDPDLFLFSISEKDGRPRLLSSLQTSSTTAGIAAMAATHSYLYIASASACTVSPLCGQLQIIDIRDPLHPKIVGRLLLSTTQAITAKSIFYKNGRVYLGLSKTPDASTNPEFSIIDVHDPAVPKLIGGYPVTRTINQIRVVDDTAYLATDNRANGDVLVLDVHDPTSINVISMYAASPSSNTSSGYVHTIAVSDHYVYVGRTVIRNGDELTTLTTAKAPIQAIASKNTAISTEALIAQGSLLFSLTTNALQIWDITDPNQLLPFGNPISLPSSGVAAESYTALVCKGNTFYAASHRTDGTGELTVLQGS